jgi:hypothetical protein
MSKNFQGWDDKALQAKVQAGTLRGYEVTGEKKKAKKAKYGNQKVEFDGHVFDSKKEMRRYIFLRARLVKGEITDLELQREYPLVVRGEDCGSYFADFVYKENGETVVEDVKSPATRKISKYRLKKRLMKAIWNIEIKEV